MPFETTRETHGLFQKFWGVVASPELFESLKKVYGAPHFGSLRYVLKDFLDVEVFDVGVKTLLDGHAFSKASQAANPHIVIAVVTTNPKIIETARLAASYKLDSYQRKIFATVDEAREWIKSAG